MMHADCVSCTLPVDLSKPHYKRNRGQDIYCIACAYSCGLIIVPGATPVEAAMLKDTQRKQLYNWTRKRRFRR